MSSRGWLGGSFCIQNDTKSCQGFHRSLAIVLQCDKQIPLERKSLECNILRHYWLLALEVASVVVLFLPWKIHCTNNSTSTAPPPTSSFVFKCLCNPKFEWRRLEYQCTTTLMTLYRVQVLYYVGTKMCLVAMLYFCTAL